MALPCPPPRGSSLQPPPLLLTAAEVARRLSITTRTLFRLVAAGVLPAPLRFSRKLVRWRAADLDRFLAAWKNRTTPP
jgi:excisionase family DNA binding protein